MSITYDGGPAFPAHGSMGEIVEHGMSVRDYFAAKSLPGLISAIMQQEGHNWDVFDFAREAYSMADAMLDVRSKSD